jgi:hypothetical protein
MNKLRIPEYPGVIGELKLVERSFFELLKAPAVPHLFEHKIGKFEVKIDIVPANTKMVVVSARNWLMTGYKMQSVFFTEPRPVFKLYEDGNLRMSDTPQEMFQQYEAYKNAKGKVLIGGLGLGMSPTLFANKKDVDSVTVIEIEKDVIKLCKPKNKKIKVIHDDIWHFLETTTEKFDFIYIDIHYSTGCMEYIKTVLPMRKILDKKFKDIPSYFWAEEEMKAQYDPNYHKEVLKNELSSKSKT